MRTLAWLVRALKTSQRFVIASDSEAIQTQLPPQSLSLDCFALLAMTALARCGCGAL
jgi:hypothetical protein